jgi:general secretion pathway protein D
MKIHKITLSVWLGILSALNLSQAQDDAFVDAPPEIAVPGVTASSDDTPAPPVVDAPAVFPETPDQPVTDDAPEIPVVDSPVVVPVEFETPTAPAPEVVPPVEVDIPPAPEVVPPVEVDIPPAPEVAPESPAAPAGGNVIDPEKRAEAQLTAEQQIASRGQQMKASLKLLDDAEGDFKKGDYAAAISKLEKVLQTMPVMAKTADYIAFAKQRYAESQRAIAKSLYDRRMVGANMPDALSSVSKGLAIFPDHAESLALKKEIESFIEANPPIPVEDTEAYETRQKKIARLIREGKSHLEVNELDEAKSKFQQVLLTDKYHVDAMRMMADIARRQHNAALEHRNMHVQELMKKVTETWYPPLIAPPVTPTGGAPAAQRIRADDPIVVKMKNIPVDELTFKNAPVDEVINELGKISREKDPDKIGLNMVLITKNAAADANAAPEVPAAPDAFGFGFEQPAAGDVGPARAASTGVNFSVRRSTLFAVLQLVCESATLHYTIENGIVVIRDEASQTHVTRFYPVDPALMSGIIGAVGPGAGGANPDPWGAGGGGGGIGGGFPGGAAQPAGPGADIRAVFQRFGAKFPQGSSISYEPAITQLIITNTPENLEKIEEILDKLQITPRQVEIETRFVEVLQTKMDEFGFKWFLTDPWEIAVEKGTGPISTRPRIQMDSSDQGITRGTRNFYWNPLNSSVGAASSVTRSDSATPMGNIASFSSILTNPELQVVLTALDQSGHSDLLSAPRVTTLSGVSAVIEVVREIIYPTEFDVSENDINFVPGGGVAGQNQNIPFIPPTVIPGGFETRQVGVILNVTPTINPDNYTINLVLVPEIAELTEWLQYGTQIGLDDGSSFNVNMPQPVFSSRRVTTTMVVWDGQTVVMGGLIREDLVNYEDKIPLLGDIPLLGYLFRSKGTRSEKRNLMIFVTARLVDPGGNSTNRDRQRELISTLSAPAANP